jgi:deoxyadenosine/deoxycytidine kinase
MIVSIDGNIGSGKSTLIELLRERFKNNCNIIFVDEPVEEWKTIQDENGVTMLEKFYADQQKYSFPFQMMAYISRLNIIKEAVLKNPCTIIITERSLFTDKMVFAKMLYDSGNIEPINYQIYMKWFHSFADDYPLDKVIYVKADPGVCIERISKRSRVGEANIPLQYIETCHKYHDEMISDPDFCKDQLILDGNINILSDKNALKARLDEIYYFINTIHVPPPFDDSVCA